MYNPVKFVPKWRIIDTNPAETVSAYLHNIFKLNGLPLIITTARGVQFTSKFWKKHINTPYILVGYFNMSKSQCDRKYLERKDSTRRLYLEKKKKENNNNGKWRDFSVRPWIKPNYFKNSRTSHNNLIPKTTLLIQDPSNYPIKGVLS